MDEDATKHATIQMGEIGKSKTYFKAPTFA